MVLIPQILTDKIHPRLENETELILVTTLTASVTVKQNFGSEFEYANVAERMRDDSKRR